MWGFAQHPLELPWMEKFKLHQTPSLEKEHMETCAIGYVSMCLF